MRKIQTPRLHLVSATAAMLRAELQSPEALAAVLDAVVPPTWPPELYDADAVRYMLEWLEAHPAEAAWGLYYILEDPAARGDSVPARPLTVGAGGYKGAPDTSGSVEIGYSVLPGWRRRGYAREAVDGWLANAFADPRVHRIVAHTLVDLAPSIEVLRSSGFTFNGAAADAQEPSAIQYVLARDVYNASVATRYPVRLVGTAPTTPSPAA